MSRFVAALVYQKRAGSMARKSILAYCAERANDDGSGIWASKVRIAKEVECSKQTVIDTLKTFVDEGLMIEAGRRKTPHGYTVEYAINIAAVKALPDAFEDPYSVDDLGSGSKIGPVKPFDGSTHLTPRSQLAGPQGVNPLDPNRPLTVLKPSIEGSDLFSEKKEPENPDSDSDLFETFWQVFPPGRKTDKKGTRELFWKIVHGKKRGTPKTSAETLVDGARRFAESNPDPQWTCGPTVWLNQERWDADLPVKREPDPPKPGPSRGHRARAPQWGEVVR
jgi:hypothetical protein